ncbi:hypothetical protein VRRI112168_02780 [Vreelandella rituensis]|uniref:Uncharacterized protein n=1 Tax=Vreelandella rituensis TaxID=2282306 RepID=A0A368U8Z5_9GAMM|nr:hypothetical protein [Halomonas rituensis]RCV93668.1 hypothetical protein DU506_00495 [Halomonas rituensis]
MATATHWTVEQGFYAEALDDVFVHEGIPVLVHSAGLSPHAVSEHGESTRDVPHFTITYCSRTTHPTHLAPRTTYTDIQVTGNHEWEPSGIRRVLTLWEKRLSDVTDLAPYIEQAKAHLDVALLRAIPARYAEADARIDQANAYPDYLSRQAYETACEEVGVRCLDDAQCNGLGVFSYPFYDADTVLSMRLADKRWLQRNQDAKAKAAEASIPPPPVWEIPKRNGQLWEPCEHCGKEPIYMPLHVCMDCWPK